MKTNIKLIGLLLSLISLATLNSCGGGSGGGNASNNDSASVNLVPDQVASIPVVNNNQTQFYVYVYNPSKDPISNLSWNITSGNTSAQNSRAVGKIINWLSDTFSGKLTASPSATNAISFVGGSGCNNIPGNTSCRLLLAANSPGSAILQGSSGNGHIVTSRIISSYLYTTTNNNNDSNSLILSPVPSIVTTEAGRASFTFSVINNSSSFIDVSSVFGILPSGINWQPVSCNNPLPSGGVCQIRIVGNISSVGLGGDLQLNLNLGGGIVNPDGSSTPLPPQNSSAVVTIVKNTLGNMQAGNLGLSLNANNPNSGTTTVGYIQNTGTGSASLGSLSIIASSAFKLSNDNCSNQSLLPQAICSYSVTATVSAINQAGNTSIIVPYNNGISSLQTLATLDYSYIAPIPAAAPQINISSPSSLNQITPAGNIMVSNSGNVALNILNGPSITGGSANQVAISDLNGCTGKLLAIGASCNYQIVYSPAPPSQDSSITIGGIKASYTDPQSGSSVTKTFTNTSGINLNSVFGGLLTASSVSLTESGAIPITIQNIGNYQAQITTLTVNGNNVELVAGGSCSIGQILESGVSCIQKISLIDANTAGNGNATLTVTYNNNNGVTNASVVGNISWVIGDQPSLYVSFNPSSLITTVNAITTSTITLINNGNEALSDIQFPSLTAPLSYISGGNCDLSGAQSLNKNESCTAILQYAPTIAQAQTPTTLGSGIFSASYTGGSYNTSPYIINLTALAPSALVATPLALNPNLDWTNNIGYIQPPIKVTNQSSSSAYITSITQDDPYLEVIAGNCSDTTLESGASCTFIVFATYPTELNSYSDNGNITINYTNSGGSTRSTVVSVNTTLSMRPIVSPGLAITGSLPSSLTAGTSTTTILGLTNTSTATNNGDASINVFANSLTGTVSGSAISTGLTINGVTNPCNVVNNIVTLASGASCNIGLTLTAAGTTDGSISSPLLTITPSFTYNVYTNQSTTPGTSGVTIATSSVSGTITVTDPAASLNISYNTTSGTAVSSIAVEQGSSPNPAKMVITITNTGNTPVTNISVPTNIPGGTLSSNCSVLAVNGSCQATMSIYTNDIISSDLDINTVTFYDNYHQGGQTISFPSFPYSINQITMPIINSVISTAGCSTNATGNGLSGSTCHLNPESTVSSNVGGAGAFNVVITYTNNSSEPAQDFAAFSATPSNYTTVQNNCTGITLNQNDSCSIYYGITTPSSTTINLNIPAGTYLDNGYSYQYGSQGQFHNTVGQSTRLPNTYSLLVSSVTPSISLSIQTNPIIITSGTTNLTGLISNWYTAAPSILFTSSNTSMSPPAACNATLLGNGGASCSNSMGPFSLGGSTTLKAQITLPSGATGNSATQTLNVVSSWLYLTNYTGNSIVAVGMDNVAGVAVAAVKNVLTTGLSSPTGINVYNSLIYIANESNNTVINCNVNTATALLSLCGSSTIPVTAPSSIAFNNGYAYIPSGNSNQIAQCLVAGGGSLTGCSVITMSYSGGTRGIAFNSVNGSTYVYLTNAANNAVYYCNVAVNGGFTSCASTGSGFTAPYGITFNVVNGTNYAYIIDSTVKGYSQCTITNTGSLSCAAAAVIVNNAIFSTPTVFVFYAGGNTVVNTISTGSAATFFVPFNTTTGVINSSSWSSPGYVGGYGMLSFVLN